MLDGVSPYFSLSGSFCISWKGFPETCLTVSDDLVGHVAVDVGQTVVAAAAMAGQFGMVQTEQVRNGRVQVVDVGTYLPAAREVLC